jgi:hypothetical protein
MCQHRRWACHRHEDQQRHARTGTSAPGRRISTRYRSVRVVGVRLTEFRGLMQEQFGPLRAPSVARDHVFGSLQGRTADEALADGVDPKAVWFAVCDDFDVSDSLRYGLPD